jgi:hypothetical protein
MWNRLAAASRRRSRRSWTETTAGCGAQDMNDRALLGAMFVAGVSTAVLGGLAVTDLGGPPAVRPSVERSAAIGPPHAPPSIALRETPGDATVMQAPVDRPVTEALSSTPQVQARESAPVMPAPALPPMQAPVSRPSTATPSSKPAPPAPVDSSITAAAAIAPLTQTPASPPAAQSPSRAPSTPTPLHQAVDALSAQADQPIAAAPVPSTLTSDDRSANAAPAGIPATQVVAPSARMLPTEPPTPVPSDRAVSDAPAYAVSTPGPVDRSTTVAALEFPATQARVAPVAETPVIVAAAQAPVSRPVMETPASLPAHAPSPSAAQEGVSDSTGSVGPRPGPPATTPTASSPPSSMVRKPSGARSSLLRRELSRQDVTGPDQNLTSVAPPTAASPADASPPLRGRERGGRRSVRADKRTAFADWRHRPAERRFPVTPSRVRWNEELRGEARRHRSPVTVIYGMPPMRGRESGPVLIHVESSRAGGRVIRTTRIPLY